MGHRFVTGFILAGVLTVLAYAVYYFCLLPQENVTYDRLAFLAFWPAMISRVYAVDWLGGYSRWVMGLEFMAVGGTYGFIGGCIRALRRK